MIPEERRNTILTKLDEKGVYSVNELVKELSVSRVTVQRDIKILKERGLLQKVHGGIRAAEKRNAHIETLFSARLKQNVEKKVEIAGKAIEFVRDHSTIFIDSSSTCFIFARELFKKRFVNLSIITTSPSILNEAMQYPEATVVSTGGLLRQNFSMFAGKWVVDFLEQVNIDTAFISAAGLSPSLQITTSNADLGEILRVVFRRAQEINLLADSSKFFISAMLDIAHVNDCRRIISDGGLRSKLGELLSDEEMPELVF
jgi:DeoR/GlpR family transcriptional regulator of sugar metabolism